VKLYFRFDLEFTYTFHAFAIWLKRDRQLRDEDFRGMVLGRLYYDYLANVQTDIRYPHLSTYQDLMWRAQTEPADREFLTRMEKTLDVDTLWRIFDSDRSIQHFSNEQALSALTIFLKYFIEEFTTHRPDAVISFVTGNVSALACYYVARHLGIPYLEFVATRLQRRALVTTSPMNDFPEVEERYREFLAGRGDPESLREAEAYLAAFRTRPLSPDGLARFRALHERSVKLSPRRFLGWLRINYWWYFSHYRHDIATDPPIRQALNVLRMKLRQRKLRQPGFFERSLPADEPYVYFPLHYQPELTTMVLAPFWQDQPSVIANIARSLPLGIRLYVKEHVPMLGLRPVDYYDRLRAIPNVRLIDPYLSSLDLIQKSELVITITGTAGFEAALLRRPVIAFSDIFYNAMPGVQRCRAPEDLPGFIREALASPPADDRQVLAYVAALLDDTFEFDMDDLGFPERPFESVRDAPSTQRLYDAYMRVFNRVIGSAKLAHR